jgi:hypothetical protein
MARSGGRMTTTTTIPDQGQPVTAPTVRRRWRVKRPLALDSVSVHPPTTDSPSPAEASQRSAAMPLQLGVTAARTSPGRFISATAGWSANSI